MADQNTNPSQKPGSQGSGRSPDQSSSGHEFEGPKTHRSDSRGAEASGRQSSPAGSSGAQSGSQNQPGSQQQRGSSSSSNMDQNSMQSGSLGRSSMGGSQGQEDESMTDCGCEGGSQTESGISSAADKGARQGSPSQTGRGGQRNVNPE